MSTKQGRKALINPFSGLQVLQYNPDQMTAGNHKLTQEKHMSTKQGRKAVMPKAPAAGGKFAHLLQERATLAAESERRNPLSVAAKIIEAGKKRRGEIQ